MEITCKGCGTTTSVHDSRRRFCSWDCYLNWRRAAYGALNARMARRVKKLHAAGLSARTLAVAFAVDEWTIRRILSGKHWTQR